RVQGVAAFDRVPSGGRGLDQAAGQGTRQAGHDWQNDGGDPMCVRSRHCPFLLVVHLSTPALRRGARRYVFFSGNVQLASVGSTSPVDRTMSNMSSKPFHSLRARARYEGTTIWWSLARMYTSPCGPLDRTPSRAETSLSVSSEPACSAALANMWAALYIATPTVYMTASGPYLSRNRLRKAWFSGVWSAMK